MVPQISLKIKKKTATNYNCHFKKSLFEPIYPTTWTKCRNF